MALSARSHNLLRRRGVWLVARPVMGALVRVWLDGLRVPVAVARFFDERDVARAPRRPIVLVDLGALDRAVPLARALRRIERPPPLVVVGDAIERGLAELGWRESTHRVGFVRTRALVDDLTAAFEDLLSGEPDLDESDGPPPDPDAVGDIAFDIDALRAELISRLSWAAPVVERVGQRLEVRANLPELEGAIGRLEIAWPDGTDAKLRLVMHAPLPPWRASFSARRATGGLRGLLAGFTDVEVGEPAFDAAHVVHADRAGLEEARAQVALLDDVAPLAELAFDDDSFEALADGLARVEALALADSALALWRGLARGRLGA